MVQFFAAEVNLYIVVVLPQKNKMKDFFLTWNMYDIKPIKPYLQMR